MNCPDDGILQARVDGELTGGERGDVDRHLGWCAHCQIRVAQITAQAEHVRGALAALAPSESEAPSDPAAAFAHFRTTLAADVIGAPAWWRRVFASSWRPAWGVAMLACLVAVCLSFAPARTWAEKILAMLRVQKIAVVSIYPASTDLGQDNRTTKLMSQFISDNLVVTMDPGKPRPVASAAAAGKYAGFPVRVLTSVGSPQKILVHGETAFQMTLNRDRLQSVLQDVGRTGIQLPESIDGALVAVHIPKGVFSLYGNCPERTGSRRGPGQPPASGGGAQSPAGPPESADSCIVMVQSPSPTVSVPPEINIAQVAEAGLELAGMSPDEARSFCQTVDWSSTLVIPVPRNISSYRTVSVDGVTGTLIEMHSRVNRYSLLWVKNGIIYVLDGRGDGTEALTLAESLR